MMEEYRKEECIAGEKIILRPMAWDDTERIICWRNRDFVRKNFIYQKPFTVEGHREWIRTMIDTGKAAQFIICEKDGRPIGSTYLRDIDYETRKAEYGIFIGEKDALGKGYGTEAAIHMAEYAFCVLKLHKVFLRLLADNRAAERSYEKAGFIREAYLKDEVRLEGIYKDVILMAKIRKE